ncbi:MAG: Gfo/Idh/MocA family oxidoreductase [Acidobacteriota bacterium]|nr:Gfo/Idh/MocA family oxidoreductase [Acidobacteriota bacterium]
MNRPKISRRQFIGGASASVASVMVVPRHVLGKGVQAPSDTLNIAGVGVGGRGRADLEGCRSQNIVALCDVDSGHAAATFRQYPNAAVYSDYRRMLDQESDVDAVIIATPDHTHAVIATEAMKREKHVYCEKPLTRTVAEARALATMAREAGVVTQMGNQGHAGEGTRQIREWIDAGVIGTVREVHYWTNRPIWPQAIDRPTDAHHPPPGLDWDLFLGPAPYRPYHPAYHPFRWRGWWDYGTGALGDIACHSMDAAFWALQLGQPDRIEAETTRLFSETAPAVSRIVYHFPARDTRPPVRFVWRDGNLAMPRPPQLADGEQLPGGSSGQLFVGDDGVIGADMYARGPRVFPTALHQDVIASPPSQMYPRSPGVYQEWIDACKGSGKTGAGFSEHAGPLTEVVLLGNLAVRTGHAIEWDASRMRVVNVPEANAFLDEEYREGWSL